MLLNLSWGDIKAFSIARKASLQWFIANNSYYIAVFDGRVGLTCQIPMDGSAPDDQTDFETNYKTSPQTNLPPTGVVTTQYELNNKDLKLAKIGANIQPITGWDQVSGLPDAYQFGNASQCVSGFYDAYILSSGTFGQDFSGRYVAGGYSNLDSYDIDDFMIVSIEDKDRILAGIYGQQAGTDPLTDAQMQAQGDYPDYPSLRFYTDTELPLEQQGWFFWPVAMGNNIPPIGECEVEPLGGYGFIPAGFYLKIRVLRPHVPTGILRICVYWGKYSGI
jgi:hypothetical protein